MIARDGMHWKVGTVWCFFPILIVFLDDRWQCQRPTTGDVFDPFCEADMAILQVMSDCNIRAGMSSVVVRVRRVHESWIPYRAPPEVTGEAQLLSEPGVQSSSNLDFQSSSGQNFIPSGADLQGSFQAVTAASRPASLG